MFPRPEVFVISEQQHFTQVKDAKWNFDRCPNKCLCSALDFTNELPPQLCSKQCEDLAPCLLMLAPVNAAYSA